MKKTLFAFAIFALVTLSLSAQTKKNGTPDMRYKANKQNYFFPSYSVPKTNTPRNYPNGGQYKVHNGYQKRNGTFVFPHIKTTPDNIKWNNAKPRNQKN